MLAHTHTLPSLSPGQISQVRYSWLFYLRHFQCKFTEGSFWVILRLGLLSSFTINHQQTASSLPWLLHAISGCIATKVDFISSSLTCQLCAGHPSPLGCVRLMASEQASAHAQAQTFKGCICTQNAICNFFTFNHKNENSNVAP